MAIDIPILAREWAAQGPIHRCVVMSLGVECRDVGKNFNIVK